MNSALIRWLLDVDRIPNDAESVRLGWEHPFASWVWALLVILIALFAVWSYSRMTGNRRGRGVLAVVRSIILLLALVLISGPMLEMPRDLIEEDWLIILADRSESMQIADAPSEASRLSRDRQLQSILGQTASTWNDLDEYRHLLWLGFHDGVFDLSQIEENEEQEGLERVSVDLGEAKGRRTNLNNALEQALQRAAARPIAGVVVFSDGRSVEPPARSLIRRLQAEQIQVFVVPLGSDEPLGDIAVRRVDAPRRAFISDKVPVVVELDKFGEAVEEFGGTIKLVDQETGEVLDEVDLERGIEHNSVTLTAEPKQAGDATWQVVIETDGNDLVEDNNIRPFSIELVDRPLRVLYVEGYPRWEFRYLRWMLIREKTIESSIMLISADRDFAQEGNTPITRMPSSPEEFAEFDVIILGDVPGTFFSPSQAEMIRDHIAERGAGLLWIGGERWTPRSFIGTAGVFAELLPIRGSLALSTISEPVNMEPTQLSERLGVLRLLSSGEQGWPEELSDPSYRWSRIWWAQRIEPGQLKPTAQPLAETTMTFDGEKLPLVVHMRYGSGQTIYVATDEIWRWRYGRGDLLPEQFWIQMIRMLGRETLAGAETPVYLEVDPRRIPVGQPMQIRLRLLDARLAELNLPGVKATLQDADGAILAEIDLRKQDGVEGEFTSTFLPNVVGSLRVRVDDPIIASEPLVADVEVFNPENELRRPETDHNLLASLASSTNGQILDVESIRDLPEILPNRSVATPNPLSERIWDTPLAFLLILLCLTGEWIGRKVLRLA